MIKPLTVQEIIEITGKSQNTIYRYIRSGKLKSDKVIKNGKQVSIIYQKDLSDFLNGNGNTIIKPIIGDNTTDNTMIKSNDKITKENLADTVKEVFTTDKTLITEISNAIQEKLDKSIEMKLYQNDNMLVKSLEEQAMYIAGKFQTENQFLKVRLETVIEENKELREAMKVLPGPIPKIQKKLEQQEAAIATLEEEKEKAINKQKEIQQEAAQALQIVQEKESTIKKLQEEKETILSEKESLLQEKKLKEQTLQQKEETIEELRIEKESVISAKNQLLAVTEQELENIKKKAEEFQTKKEKESQAYQKKIEEKEQEEKDLMATLEEMKKRLEEEEKKPWWKKIFSM